MILKLLLVIAVIGIIYFIFFKKKTDKKSITDKNEQANEMVECCVCGIYSEIDDSILSNGKYYCSNECLREVR
ncbi:MAG: PP0621 family protein [Campylobacterota bacterium]|nr:PP0621 family protein [Campylobacterota bacterium]